MILFILVIVFMVGFRGVGGIGWIGEGEWLGWDMCVWILLYL